MNNLIEDVTAASAAYLVNVLPEIAKLPASEQYKRLEAHFLACLMAYRECLKDWLIPSEN